jgi:glycosyltransferase involved in cell wall biosynthesis
MRIALFSGNYNYIREGANQALNMLVAYLEGRGHQVRVYSPVTDTPAFEPAGTLVPVPSIAFPVRNEFRLALGLPRSIRRNVLDFAPDIVHVATPDILNTRAQTFARQLGIPIVASMHTRFETYLDHYHLGWLRPGVEALLRRFYRRSDHVLAPTPPLVEEMMRLRGDHEVSLWSRGVDRKRFDPARRDMTWRRAQGWADEDVVLLFFGRLVLEKGVEDYASAVGILEKRGLRVRPLVVGAGPASDPFKALRGAVLTGHLQDDELARAIASADILLNPSRSEAFGNVVLEAMASGLAIVSADAPSATALIEHAQTGLLCPPGDPAVYADAVESLVAVPERRQRIGSAARSASAAYRWNDASASVERAYQKLLDRKAAMRHD